MKTFQQFQEEIEKKVPSVEMLDSIEIYNAGDYDGNIDLK